MKKENVVVKQSCHSRGMLSGIYDVLSSLINRKKAFCINNKYAGDPRQNSSGMTALLTTEKAFTLIELLVVVLIIGILAAVALPQYQKAVYKSRATEALAMLKAIVNAQEVYYLANGSYTDDISKLDVEVPSELITTESATKPANGYKYYCHTSGYCYAATSNANMPDFEFRGRYRGGATAGKFFCHLTSGDSKNESVKSLCLSMGGVLFTGWDRYNWAKGKYFIIN